jgi:hypothetical protein
MRRLISAGLAAALLLAVAPAVVGVLRGLPWSHGEAASSTLTCSVKASCAGLGEVAVFRMSSLTNAHAETAAGTTYGNIVCCSGVTGLTASCAVSHTTVLRLWAATNAHVARASETSYTTEACLSAPSTTITCQYGSSCDAGAGYVCLATMSGAGVTNAHVADCDGTNDYATKVCCSAGAAPPVGGIAELPNIGGTSPEQAGAPAEGSGWSAGGYAALAGGLAAAAFAIAVGGWYARRRWLR